MGDLLVKTRLLEHANYTAIAEQPDLRLLMVVFLVVPLVAAL